MKPRQVDLDVQEILQAPEKCRQWTFRAIVHARGLSVAERAMLARRVQNALDLIAKGAQ